ncbi:MAG: MFS transporter [Acidibacillus sp.]|nr:MFS transporter [Acidibacillus sp.]
MFGFKGIILPKEVWALIIINMMMSIIFNFTSIFINLFLWNQGQNIFSVSLFNLSSVALLFVSYLVGSYFLYQRSIRFVLVMSCIFAGFSFFALYLSHGQAKEWMIIFVGAMSGITQGLFWSANNSALYRFLKSEQYADYFSVNTVIAQAVTILVPLFSSLIIFELTFHVAFLFMLIFVIFGLLSTLRLPNVSMHQSLYQDIGFKKTFSKPGTKWSIGAIFSSGFINQFLALFSMVFIFNITNQVGMVALLNVGYSIVSLGGLFLYRRYHISQNKWLIIGVLLIFSSYIMALYDQLTLGIMVVLFMRLGSLFFSASSSRQRYRVLMQGDIIWRTKMGMWLEIPLVLARSSVLIVALYVHEVKDGAFLLLIILSSLAMLLIPFFQTRSIAEYEAVYGVGAGL